MSGRDLELVVRLRDAGQRIEDSIRANRPRTVFDPPLLEIESGLRRLSLTWGELHGERRLYVAIAKRRGDGSFEILKDGTFAFPTTRLPAFALALADALESVDLHDQSEDR